MIHSLESFFVLNRLRCPPQLITGIFDIRHQSKINYGKSVNPRSLFIGFCDLPVKITLICMVNSFVELQQVSAFRKIANSLPAVVICRYESLHCDDRFVMKQNHNHESDQINCFCCRLFYQHNNECSKQHSFFRFRT